MGIAWGGQEETEGGEGQHEGMEGQTEGRQEGMEGQTGGTDEGTAGGTWARPALTRGPAAPATSRNAPLGFTRQSPQRSGRGG